MQAAAQQEKPKKKAGGNSFAPRKQAQRKDFKEKLYDLPQAAGVAIMALLLVLALFAGNFRALQKATPKDFIRQGDVQSIVEDRIDAAQNVLTLSNRAALSANLINEAEAAVSELEKAKTAREISRANQRLTAAVSALTTAEISPQDTPYMQRAADEFAELGSFLRQEARAYNEKAEKAEALYERLPTKFVLPQVDMYEGV